MDFDIKSYEASVKAKLETIGDFTAVFDTYTLEAPGYPFVSFEMTDFDGVKGDSCQNHRIITFSAVVLQNINPKAGDNQVTRETAKGIIYNCLNSTINAFDKDLTLGNANIINQKVLKGELGTINSGQGDAYSLAIDIILEVVNSSHS